jgi:hypothetical protein
MTDILANLSIPEEKGLPNNRDFSHCEGGHCPMKKNCIRHLSLLEPLPGSSTRGISMMGDIPVANGKCSYYWELTK